VKGGYAVNLTHLGFGVDSSFQNTSEFIGVILGLVAMVSMGVRNVDLELRGDSTAALSWAETEKFHGSNSANAAMVFTLICIAFGFNVRNAIHKPGEQNWRADTLSRLEEKGMSMEEGMKSIGLEGVPIVRLEENSNAMTLLRCCNPLRAVGNEEEFNDFWDEIRGALVGLGADEQGPNEIGLKH
jgi:hypothetical protein